MLITSPQNSRIKQLVRLRAKRQRAREGLMLVEGRAEFLLALEGGAHPRSLFVCPELSGERASAELLAQVAQSGAECFTVTSAVFEKIAYRENPDGCLAVFPWAQRTLTNLHLSDSPLLLVAESIEKPGNLGAILRSADAVGADALMVCDPTTDVTNPNVVRASKGTLFTVPVVEASSADALQWLREQHIIIIAATPQAEPTYTEADLRGPVAIVVGAEDAGLSETWLKQADLVVRIPMRGRVNSLNVATATTLLLYEAVRQRDAKN